jgi:hypothetical protein
MSDQPVPIISRACEDGTLVETIYDASRNTTRLAICSGRGDVFEAPEFTSSAGERWVPYSPQNNLLSTGCVLLPAKVGEVRDKRDLVEEIRRYLARYVYLSPVMEEVVPYYVLLSWVYDAFNEIPYLRFKGDYGTGKSRALLAVGSVCYKPFFASGASTVSPIFHVLDAFGGTLLLDEADFRFSDATAELTKVLNNGNMRGLPVLRTMTNRHRELNPTAFRVFGPKIVSMRGHFADRALESRFITEETGGRVLPPHIPIHLPATLQAEARELRNRLLAWRFAERHAVSPDAARLLPDVPPRLNQTALPLLSLIDDADLRGRLARHLVGGFAMDQGSSSIGLEHRLIAAVADAFERADAPYAPITAVTENFNDSAESSHIPYSAKAVGGMVRRLGFTTKKSRGIYVIPQQERARLADLRSRFGVLESDSGAGAPSTQA